jgi:hypothetical protein
MTRTTLPRTPARLDAIEGSRPLDEQFLGMIVSLASEITVLREKLDACERLLVAGGTLSADALSDFAPDAAATAERDAQRRRSIEKIFRPLREGAIAERREPSTHGAST